MRSRSRPLPIGRTTAPEARPLFPNSVVMLLGKRNVVMPMPAPRMVTGDEPLTLPVITYLSTSSSSQEGRGGGAVSAPAPRMVMRNEHGRIRG